MGWKYGCVMKLGYQKITYSLNLLVDGILHTIKAIMLPAGKGGGARRGNPSMRDEHTHAHCCRETHNLKLGEKG